MQGPSERCIERLTLAGERTEGDAMTPDRERIARRAALELARFVVEERGLAHRCTVRPCTSAEYPTPTKRPPYSVLDLSKTEALVGTMPDWREHVREVLARLEPL